ncbi:MAG: ABC transporter substrate-binding protein [Candidatus Methanomethylophilaceae archaeon]|nr:ABC transporter substrate-binding protein [Candidatus Methanomethylophilaceae archaeon]
MNANILIAVAAVAILIGGGVGIYAIVKDNGNGGEKEIEPRDVTIKDSLGNDVTVTAPVTKICTTNTSAAEFFKILGVEKRIVGMDTSGKKALGNVYKDVTDIGNYKTPSGEKIAETGAKYVISQSSSRSLSTETEQALKDNYGIIVLRIDCFGETMMQDVEQLLKIIISEDADNAFADYKSIYNSIVAKAKEKAAAVTGDPSFLFMVASMSATAGTYYSENSELGKIVKSLHGHNALTDMEVTSKTATAKPAASKILNYDQLGNLDYVFIRGTDSTTPAQDYATFINTGGDLNFENLNVVANRNVYVIHTDVLSGPRDYIGYVCICEAYGIDTGLDYAKLTSDFDEKYGFGVTYPYIIQRMPSVA